MNTTHLSSLTYPIAARIRAEQVLKMQALARQLEISMSKLVGLILDDVLPAFDSTEDTPITLKVANSYRLERAANTLRPINEEEEYRKLLARVYGQFTARPGSK